MNDEIDRYVSEAAQAISMADEFRLHDRMAEADYWLKLAQVNATLALTAATRKAARS